MADDYENRGFFNGWGVGAGAGPTIYDNGGLPTPIDRIPAQAPQRAATGSNYVGDGPTDPDANARNFSKPSRISVSPESLQMHTNAGNAYDPLGTKPMRDASEAGRRQVQSLYPRGTYPDTPSPRDMPKALAAESQQRVYGPAVNRSGAANPNSAYGQGSVRTSSGIGSFAEDGQTYNVGTTSQDNIRRVTGGKLNSPLYTNIDPSQAVAGLRNQTIGQPADEAQLGIDRYQRANDIRGGMIANRDRDIPAGGYGPGILQDPNEALNAERTQRWGQDDLMRYAKNNPEMRGIVQQLIQSDSTRDINANNVAGRMNELGLQGRNQLAAYGLQGRNQMENTLLGEGLRGRNQQTMDDRRFDRESGLLDRRIAAEAPYRDAQAGLFTAQAGRLHDEIAYGKTELGMYEKLFGTLSKTEPDPDVAHDKTLKAMAAATKEARRKAEGKAADGAVGYADGGGVASMSRAQQLLADMDAKYGKAVGNAPAPQPAPVPPPVQQQPQGIADKFRGYFGAPDARMKQNGLAFGGAVPPQDIPGGRAVAQAVAGRQVFGQSDGSGRDDALPAVIDGERPAALTSGEFVWPVNAVKFYGMDKLNKMLAAAEKGMASQGDTA